jgi:transposase
VSNLKLLSKILRLKGMKVTGFQFKDYGRELHLGVKPYKNGAACVQCGRRGRIVSQGRETRSWEDIAILGRRVLLWYQPKEIECPTHGRAQEEIPWAAPYSRITYRNEWRICSLCQIMTQKAAAQIVCMAPSTLSDLLHRIISRVRSEHHVRGLKSIGVDEISYKKRHRYATLVYDLDRARVVWVGAGKGRDTIDRFFNQALSAGQKERIRWASSDMSLAYTEAIKAHCPKATLVIDRFHVVKALNEAVDEVRKEQWRELGTEKRKAIKGLRWLLGRSPATRTKADTRQLHQLARGNRRIYRAWLLKDEFEHFWSYRYVGSAKAFLKRWMTAALKSRLPSMRDFVNTLRQHSANILTYVERSLTNAVAEGINRIVKIAKNRASGFRGLHNFADMIYLIVGDLDIPEQIPSNLKTL